MERKNKKISWPCLFLVLSFMPFFITHAVPMIFVYVWMSAILIVVAVFWKSVSGYMGSLFTTITLRIGTNLYYFFLMQSFVNYAVLYYRGGEGYLHIIGHDYELRDTECYTQSMWEDRQLQMFISWF